MKKLNRRTRLVIFTALLGLLLVGIYVCGILIPEEAYAASMLETKLPPSLAHPFGTDALGRDLFARTLKGLSVSLTVGITASVISAVIAVLVGIAAATGSKRIDALINWVIDLVMSVPHTILVLLISFALGRGLKGLLMGIAATHWCSLARLIRAEVLQLRSRSYVTVSRRLGKSSGWILTHHLLPHLVPQFIVGLILLFPHAILHEAAVSFLGYGLPPDMAAIGIILSESMRYLSVGMWWPALLPGATLVLIVLLIDKLGDQLKLLIDPDSAHE
ncbi:MAG: ABC transporter permease [Oscillospiraceae bacterium]|nr:ABC transporter permease [Oscillospiraceae bacterium]